MVLLLPFLGIRRSGKGFFQVPEDLLFLCGWFREKAVLFRSRLSFDLLPAGRCLKIPADMIRSASAVFTATGCWCPDSGLADNQILFSADTPVAATVSVSAGILLPFFCGIPEYTEHDFLRNKSGREREKIFVKK